MKKIRKLLAITVALLVFIAAAVRGQSALDGFDPNANPTVYADVLPPAGQAHINIAVTAVSTSGGGAVTHHNTPRQDPTGTVDSSVPHATNNQVLSIAVQADGKILAGGI